ncbi:MAG: hypothetical protein NC911_01275, partial [Candidatus Omnitrophica bacterium]|nr:hypothetical protein [Candidatus Omnitrophota bacterium]
DLVKIVEIQLEHLKARLAEKKIALEVAESAKKYLAAKGYDEHYGARPLKRLIQREVENVVALKVLAGEFKEGDTVLIEATGKLLEIKKTQPT